MSDYISLATASIAALVSLVIYALTKKKEREHKLAERRAEAYADFFKSQSLCELHEEGSKDATAARAMNLDSRHRIVLYGSDLVVEAMAKYMSATGNHLNGGKREAFVELLQAMARDTSQASRNGRDILNILVDLNRSGAQ